MNNHQKLAISCTLFGKGTIWCPHSCTSADSHLHKCSNHIIKPKIQASNKHAKHLAPPKLQVIKGLPPDSPSPSLPQNFRPGGCVWFLIDMCQDMVNWKVYRRVYVPMVDSQDALISGEKHPGSGWWGFGIPHILMLAPFNLGLCRGPWDWSKNWRIHG